MTMDAMSMAAAIAQLSASTMTAPLPPELPKRKKRIKDRSKIKAARKQRHRTKT